MALKVQINGSKRTLTGPGRAPVTFINGAKKRLSKGVTFINGKKVVLWDTHSLQIDYISGIYQALGNKSPFPVMATNNKMVLSSSDGYVGRFDISNVSNPILENSVEMGTVCGYSLPDSTPDKQVFFAYSRNLKIGQRININPNTVEITASNTISLPTYATTGGMLGTNTWLGYALYNYQAFYFYLNGVTPAVYSYTYRRSSGGTTMSGTVAGPELAKKSQTEFIGTQPSQAITPGIASYTATALNQRVSNVWFNSIMVEDDGTIAAAGVSGFGIYNDNYTQRALVPCTASDRTCRLVGRIRDYYYVVELPSSKDTANQKIVLRIFTREGVLFETRDLNLTMIWHSNTSYGGVVRVMPQVSQTGALVFVFVPGYESADALKSQAVRILGY